MLDSRVAIDLGTSNTLVHVDGRGIVINEPSVVAVSVDDNKILAIGMDAKVMLGRTPDTITAHRPLQDGAIADYRVTEAMLRHFLTKAVGRYRLRGPVVMVAIPAGITSTERRAVLEAAKAAGAREAYLIQQPLAAAIGATIPVAEPLGNMVIDIGGGTSDAAVVSLGGIVVSESVRIGGMKFDQAIADYVRRTHNLSIGDRSAEEIKIAIGSAMFVNEPQEMSLRGRDLVMGLPKVISINTNEIVTALTDELDQIILTIKHVLEKTPPELSADILDHGITMTGGAALLKNIPKLITQHTGVPCYVAEDAETCVVRGTAIALDNLDAFRRNVYQSK